MSTIDLTSISKAVEDISKGNLNWLQVVAILSPVILGPGVSLVTSYVNGRNNLSSRRRELEHYQAVLQVVEQASKLSADCEKLDQMFGDSRSSVLIQKIMRDAYATLKAPEPSVYVGGYKFFLLRQVPIIAKYYTTPIPKTFPVLYLTIVYYVYALTITVLYVFLAIYFLTNTDPAVDNGVVFKVLIVFILTFFASPLFYVLSKFWELLFNLRRHREDILAGVTLNGPVKTVERPDFRVGSATVSAVLSRMGRPTHDQASPDGGRSLSYATAPKRSWLGPIPVLGHLTGTIVAWFAGGAVRDVATEGFEFGPSGLLTQTWMSRSRPGAVTAGAAAQGD